MGSDSSPKSGRSRTLFTIFCIGMVVGGFLVAEVSNGVGPNDCNAHFPLLNPRWRCDTDDPPKRQEYDELKKTLVDDINTWQKKGRASFVSVYFRNLQNGSAFGIHTNERFAPASLLKTPVMIALLKYAESHPEILNEKIAMGNNIPGSANVFDPQKTLVAGQTYTVREILRRMIVYSDNISKDVLLRRLEAASPGILDQTFIDMGVSLQGPDGAQFITVRAYASLFRTLYNASYLSRESSQMALDLLSQSEFPRGIVAGVPKGIIVAQKFGYLDIDPKAQQLHNCGIVYAPTNYLLCVMTRGNSPDAIADVIAGVSREVYTEVARKDAE